MMEVINFNHISDCLDEAEIDMLKTLYKTYHKKMWLYKTKHQSFKKKDLTLTLVGSSLIIIGGGTSVLALPALCIVGAGSILTLLTKKKNYPRKIELCRFAYTSYEKILHQIKSYLRGSPYDKNWFIQVLHFIDDFITDLCPNVEMNLKDYEKRYRL